MSLLSLLITLTLITYLPFSSCPHWSPSCWHSWLGVGVSECRAWPFSKVASSQLWSYFPGSASCVHFCSSPRFSEFDTPQILFLPGWSSGFSFYQLSMLPFWVTCLWAHPPSWVPETNQTFTPLMPTYRLNPQHLPADITFLLDSLISLKKNHLVMKTRSCDVHMRLYPLNLALVGGPDCLPPEELTPLSPLSSRPSCREWAELDCSCLKQHPDWHGASSLLFSVLSFHLMDLSSLNLHPLSWHAGSSISCADLNICSHPFLSTTTLVFQTTHMFSHILWLALPAFSALGSQGKCQRMSRDVPAMCYFCKWEPWVLSQGVCILVGGSCIYNYCSLWYPVLEI